MKKTGKSIMELTIIMLMVVIIVLIGIIIKISNINNIINKQEENGGQQLTETSGDNAYVEIQTHLSEVSEQEEKLLAFKSTIATAVTNEGVTTASTDTAEIMASNIAGILKARTTLSEDVAATAADITSGKKAYVNGSEVTGTRKDNSLIYIGNSNNSTYNLTSIEGYKNLTTSNFLIKNFKQTVEVIDGGPVYEIVSSNNTPLSYNATTGVLTVRTVLGPSQYEHLEFSSTFDIYLQK